MTRWILVAACASFFGCGDSASDTVKSRSENVVHTCPSGVVWIGTAEKPHIWLYSAPGGVRRGHRDG